MVLNLWKQLKLVLFNIFFCWNIKKHTKKEKWRKEKRETKWICVWYCAYQIVVWHHPIVFVCTPTIGASSHKRARIVIATNIKQAYRVSLFDLRRRRRFHLLLLLGVFPSMLFGVWIDGLLPLPSVLWQLFKHSYIQSLFVYTRTLNWPTTTTDAIHTTTTTIWPPLQTWCPHSEHILFQI